MGNFDMLPSDVTLEILSRLPTESALDCKLVSKPWKNVIQHPSFSKNHLNHLLNRELESGKLNFLLYEQVNRFEEPVSYAYTEYDENLNCFSSRIRMSLTPPFEHCLVLGSCNGLICVNASLELVDQPFFEPAYVCNPVTREYVVLPNLQIKKFLTGFGYVPSTNEYKVVRIFNNKKDPNFGVVQVYTLGSGIGWRNVMKKMEYDVNGMYVSDHFGVFANGAIHWVDDRGIIVAFILEDEEFRELPSPPCSRRTDIWRRCYKLLVLDEYLCVRVWDDMGMCIWILNKNENYHDVCIWSKEFAYLSSYDGIPITITKSGGILCYNGYDKKVYRYAPEASSSGCLVNFGNNIEIRIPHKNTLVSLKALGEEDTKLMDSGERASSSGGQKTVIFQKAQKEETSL